MRILGPILSLFIALPAAAQERASHCTAIADAAPGGEYKRKADWRDPLPGDYTVRLRYLDRSMFLPQADGTTAVTDYDDFIGPTDLVHSGHWTVRPNPRIPHLREGRGDGEAPNLHLREMDGVLVRDMPFEGTEDGFDIYMRATSGIEVSLGTPPERPTVVVLRPTSLQPE